MSLKKKLSKNKRIYKSS